MISFASERTILAKMVQYVGKLETVFRRTAIIEQQLKCAFYIKLDAYMYCMRRHKCDIKFEQVSNEVLGMHHVLWTHLTKNQECIEGDYIVYVWECLKSVCSEGIQAPQK